MLATLVLAAMVSLSREVKDADFEKPPQNTLHDCGGAPEPYGDCRLPPGLTPQDIVARLAGKDTAYWREGDEIVVVARRDTDQAYLCCAARGRMDHIEDDLWALRLRVVHLDDATIDISVRPLPDNPAPVFRGPDAPADLPAAAAIQGRIYVEKIHSKYLDAPRAVLVYTPPGFDPKKTYPALYMGDADIRLDTPWRLEPQILSGVLPPMLIVEIFPAAPRPGIDLRSAEYLLGWPDGAGAFNEHESFVLKEVVPFVEQNFGADPKQTILTGFSSGAAWAIAMGLRHPDVFPVVIAQSFAWGRDGPGRIGAMASATQAGTDVIRAFAAAADSDTLVSALRDNTITRFYMSAGTLEPEFYKETLRFAGEAAESGHEVHLETTVGGHSLAIWRPLLLHGLLWAFTGKAPFALGPQTP
jgi:enterochelin esterase-like enzyme